MMAVRLDFTIQMERGNSSNRNSLSLFAPVDLILPTSEDHLARLQSQPYCRSDLVSKTRSYQSSVITAMQQTAILPQLEFQAGVLGISMQPPRFALADILKSNITNAKRD